MIPHHSLRLGIADSRTVSLIQVLGRDLTGAGDDVVEDLLVFGELFSRLLSDFRFRSRNYTVDHASGDPVVSFSLSDLRCVTEDTDGSPSVTGGVIGYQLQLFVTDCAGVDASLDTIFQYRHQLADAVLPELDPSTRLQAAVETAS